MKPDICEIGLSDHHKMVHSFLRKTFVNFNEELKKIISIDLYFEAFLQIFQSTFDRFAPYKQKKHGIKTIL